MKWLTQLFRKEPPKKDVVEEAWQPVMVMIRDAIDTGNYRKLRAIFGLMTPAAAEKALSRLDKVDRLLVLACINPPQSNFWGE